jgi:transcriptional regulator with XRE-family HTH domain
MNISIEKFTTTYFSNLITKWRVEKGIRQSWLANELCVSQSTLSKYENGDSEISICKLIKIAELLDIKKETVTESFGYYLKYIE